MRRPTVKTIAGIDSRCRMVGSNKKVCHFISILCITVIFTSGVCMAGNSAAPKAESITALAAAARMITENFMQDSIELRLKYDYAGRFYNETDAQALNSLSHNASLDLQNVYASQELIKKQIEDYEGGDWDRRYGQTGLWRKLCADAEETVMLKCHVDYYTALVAGPKDRELILNDIIDKCESSKDVFNSAKTTLLKAEALAAMGANISASKAVEAILARGDLPDEVYFKARMLKIKLSGLISHKIMEVLFKKAEKSSCANDLELYLKLAFAGLRASDSSLLEKVLVKWPAAQDFAGAVILEQMEFRRRTGRLTGRELSKKSVYEVELAAAAAGRQGPTRHSELLAILCGIEKLRTALVLYVAAQAHAESAPAVGLDYYLRAAMTQQTQPSDKLGIEAVEIAKRAAQLGYSLFHEDRSYRGIATQAMGYYCEIAGEDVDERIQYLYAGLLNDCGQTKKAAELLETVARDEGKFATAARLDLLGRKIKSSPKRGKEREQLKQELKLLIDKTAAESEQDKRVRTAAGELYCQLLLQANNEESARQVLETLEGLKGLNRQSAGILKAGALQRSGRMPEAIESLTASIEADDCRSGQVAVEVLSQVWARIDEYESSVKDFKSFAESCEKLTEYCTGCAQPEWKGQLELMQAEFGIVAASARTGQTDKLDRLEKTLDRLKDDYAGNVDWLRCRARLSAARGEFSKSVTLWGNIRAARKPSPTAKAADSRSWEWWRAKYYEIASFSKMPQTQTGEVEHAVEVLKNSFSEIPSFWANKLGEGKKLD